VEEILASKLEEIIRGWNEEFWNWNSDSDQEKERKFIIEPLTHELRIKEQMINIEPPLEYARFHWFQNFHKAIGIVTSLPRLEAARLERDMSSAGKQK
jgi:dynein heavy chain 1, cytosolic